MKILKVELSNFQSYKNVTVKLHKWLNVFFGRSDSGKSAFERSLRSVIENKTRIKFRRHKTDKTIVSLSDNKNTVTRIKTDSLNQYTVNNKVLKAIKTDVPREVSDTLNLSSLNIQKQKDHFYLLNDSPGKRSKELNKIAGLSITSNSLKEINSRISSLTTEIRMKNNEIRNVDDEIVSLQWVKKAKILNDRIKFLKKKQHRINLRFTKISDLIDDKEDIERKINNLIDPSAGEKCSHVLSLLRKYDLLNNKVMEIIVLTDKEISTRREIENIKIPNLSNIPVLINQYDTLLDRYLKIKALIEKVNYVKDNIRKIEKGLLVTEKELSKFKKCPTCNNIIGKK